MSHEERSKAYTALKKRNADAWQENVARAPTGDRFHDAVMALHERYDTGPLLAVLRSDHALSSANRESLARLIDLLHALGQARRPGKPGGKHTRWNHPNYIAAYLVERRSAAWKLTRGRRNVPDVQKQKIVDQIISEMKGWALTQRKRPPRKERVLELLRGSKNLRL